MIDLHSHILPGFDDGAADINDSLALAEQYATAGFKTVVATPHASIKQLTKKFAWDISKAVIELNRRLKKEGFNITVLPGMEVELDASLPEHVESHTVIPLAERNHLLVETPFQQLPTGWQKIVSQLAYKGIRVVFAHPERCKQLIWSPNLLGELMQSGVRLQLNWDSFVGAYGYLVKNLAQTMARQGMIHCLATDSHIAGKRHSGTVHEAIERVAKIVGERNLARIVWDNPEKAVNGQPMEACDLNKITVLA
jgi:protein-tyrosine phosphatase